MLRNRPVHKANEIRLKRQSHTGAFLVVEGRDDRLFMERFTCAELCKIEVAQGKENVSAVLDVLNEKSFPGTLGLVDSDFDRIRYVGSSEQNLVRPEYHDLETMLLCSPALGRVLVELGSQQKIEAFDDDILAALMKRALPLAYLRLFSLKCELNLKFEGLNHSTWIDRASFECSTKRLIQEVKNRSKRHDLSSDSLEKAIARMNYDDHDPRELCNGNDLIEILSIGLRGKLGNRQASEVSGTVLKRYLRLAYSEEDFRRSKLRKAIRDWEARELEFRILKAQLDKQA